MVRGSVPREADLPCEASGVDARILCEGAKDAGAGGWCVSRHAGAQASPRDRGTGAVRGVWTESSRFNRDARYAACGECV